MPLALSRTGVVFFPVDQASIHRPIRVARFLSGDSYLGPMVWP